MAKRLATAVLELALDAVGFRKDLEATKKGLAGLGTKEQTKALRDFGRSATDAGRALSLGLTAPIVGAGAGAVKLASDFESSFAGVRKTVDATEAEFAALSSGFREMAQTIPVNVNELNKIGEAAGQLGIKTENILGFTRVMADLGVATNLSSEEAATALARLANITQMPQSEFDRLGSTIVSLGNNFATTESEIVEMGLRIAGAGKQIGLTEHQILAVGAALSSVGIEAQAGGSAISKLMIDMAGAVETGGKQLQLYSAIAGVDFAKAFREDAAGALTLFIQGLDDTERHGASTLQALSALGIEEVRMRDALLRASGAGDLLNETLRVGSEGWTENTALTKEASERYKTFDSRLAILKNRLFDVGITLGNSLMPAVLAFMDAAAPLIGFVGRVSEVFAVLPRPIQMFTIGIVGLVAAIGPLLFVAGQLAMGLAAIAPWFAAGTTGATVLAGALTVLTGPIGIAAAAIAGLAAVWWAWGDDIKRIVRETVDLAIQRFNGLVAIAKHTYEGVKGWLLDKFTGVVDGIKAKVEAVTGVFQWMYDRVVGNSYVPDMVKGIQSSFAGLDGAMVQPTLSATSQVVGAFKQQTIAEIESANASTKNKQKKTEAQKATEEYARQVKALAEALGGTETLGKARAYMDALDKTAGLHTLTRDKQAEVLDVMREALAVYAALGQQAPAAITKVVADLERLRATAVGVSDVIDVGATDWLQFGQSASLSTDRVGDAFERMGIQTRAALRAAANQALNDYRLIAASGLATTRELDIAWAKVEQAREAATEKASGGWGGFVADLKQMFTGGNGITGVLTNAMGMLGQSGGKMGEVFKVGTAVARAFAGDWSAAMGLAQEYFGKLVDWVGKGVAKIGNWFKGLFGGPSAKELAGREVAAEFRNNIASMMNERQKAEAGNNEWAKSVIVVRDAFLALGKTEREALDAMDALWRAEKQGAGAVEQAMKPIQDALDAVNQKSQETGKSIDELRAEGVAAGQGVTSSLAAAGDELSNLMGTGKKVAETLRDTVGKLRFTIPVDFQTGGGLNVPAIPMADGGFGRVTRPTLFLAGEAGAEDFAFSGGGKRFGGGAFGRDAVIQVPVNIDGREVAFATAKYFPEAVGAQI